MIIRYKYCKCSPFQLPSLVPHPSFMYSYFINLPAPIVAYTKQMKGKINWNNFEMCEFCLCEPFIIVYLFLVKSVIYSWRETNFCLKNKIDANLFLWIHVQSIFLCFCFFLLFLFAFMFPLLILLLIFFFSFFVLYLLDF